MWVHGSGGRGCTCAWTTPRQLWGHILTAVHGLVSSACVRRRLPCVQQGDERESNSVQRKCKVWRGRQSGGSKAGSLDVDKQCRPFRRPADRRRNGMRTVCVAHFRSHSRWPAAHRVTNELHSTHGPTRPSSQFCPSLGSSCSSSIVDTLRGRTARRNRV
jgi:hypothetical protein